MKLLDICKLIKLAILKAAYLPEKTLEEDIKVYLAKTKLDDLACHSTQKGITTESILPKGQVIVSLTTHGKRIKTVHRAIESIFQQSLLSNRVVLYIGENEYQRVEQLPILLRRQMQRGLEVRFVKDQGPYTKLLPALKEFPEDVIITVDDDIYYPFDVIERLIIAHRNHQNAICALEARTIQFKSDGTFQTYDSFPFEPDPVDKISSLFIAEGFGGVLYPPHCFSEEVFNEALFSQLAPKADDLWLKAMSMINSIPILKVHDYFEFGHDRYLDPDAQDIGLRQSNIEQCYNDRFLKSLFDYYKLYDLLKE